MKRNKLEVHQAKSLAKEQSAYEYLCEARDEFQIEKKYVIKELVKGGVKEADIPQCVSDYFFFIPSEENDRQTGDS